MTTIILQRTDDDARSCYPDPRAADDAARYLQKVEEARARLAQARIVPWECRVLSFPKATSMFHRSQAE